MTNHAELISSARAELVALVGEKSRGALDLLDRFDRYADDLVAGLAAVYDLGPTLKQLVEVLAKNHLQRDTEFQQRDRARVLQPDWFQRSDTVGYVAYTDLFAKDLKGLNKKIDYLKGLGVTYLHLMPILEPRPGANDGGYAVMNYRALRSDLGTMDELKSTAKKLHKSGISLTLDLVLNHVALEHEWAEKARAGDAKYRDYFYVYGDRSIPDQFEQTLPEVFPDFAPGNFTWNDELNGWVWTTFNAYQWDVNWSNPNVFCDFADIIGNLANHGVDCLRLDAIAFIWKRMGTTCQNEEEVHSITQALRTFARILAPSLIFKAEAIVGPTQVGAYLGEGSHAGKVSDMAYHNSLMVQIWAAIASQDTKLMEYTMSRFNALPASTAWGVYLRCHDDIGWAIDDSFAHAVGLNGHMHRLFLANYFTGRYAMSDARGVAFMVDEASGESRTSGSAASLAGIETAIASKQPQRLDWAIDRYLCAYAMVFGFGGIPLLYMGDEIGMLNDASYLKDAAKAEDNRWLHRPAMDWRTANKAAAGELAEKAAGRIRERIQHLINTRKRIDSLHASVSTKVIAGKGHGVVIFERRHPAGNMVQVYNLSHTSRWVNRAELEAIGDKPTEELTGYEWDISQGFEIQPYQVLWFR